MPRVNVHDRKREAAGPERLLCDPKQHERVLSSREEQYRTLELGGDLAHDCDRLCFE